MAARLLASLALLLALLLATSFTTSFTTAPRAGGAVVGGPDGWRRGCS
jgi:hypothetical protein